MNERLMMRGVIVTLVICATLHCALGKTFSAPKPCVGFNGTVVIESSMIPVKRNGTCYWDYAQKKFRLDTKTGFVDYVDIIDFNNATRTIGRFQWFDHTCTTCFLDHEVNPLFVPNNAQCTSSGEIDSCMVTVGDVKWVFRLDPEDKSKIIQTTRFESTKTGTQSTSWTFDNLTIAPQDESLFDIETTAGPKCSEVTCSGVASVAFVINNDVKTSYDLPYVKELIRKVVSWFDPFDDNVVFVLGNYSSILIPPTREKGDFVAAVAHLTSSDSPPQDFVDGLSAVERASGGSDVDHVVFIFNDHNPFNQKDVLAQTKFYQNGGEIYVIGYNGVDDAVMKKMASPDNNPLQPHHFMVSSAVELPNLATLITAAACKNDSCQEDA